MGYILVFIVKIFFDAFSWVFAEAPIFFYTIVRPQKFSLAGFVIFYSSLLVCLFPKKMLLRAGGCDLLENREKVMLLCLIEAAVAYAIYLLTNDNLIAVAAVHANISPPIDLASLVWLFNAYLPLLLAMMPFEFLLIKKSYPDSFIKKAVMAGGMIVIYLLIIVVINVPVIMLSGIEWHE